MTDETPPVSLEDQIAVVEARLDQLRRWVRGEGTQSGIAMLIAMLNEDIRRMEAVLATLKRLEVG